MENQLSDSLACEISLQTIQLLDQSVVKLKHCLAQLDEDELWWRPQPELNSVGNLLLHMEGNLRQWSIVALGSEEDRRQRDREFSATRRLLKSKVWEQVSITVEEAKTVISEVQPTRWLDRLVVQGFDVNVINAVIHTTTHFQGHTHQVILLTRMIRGEGYSFQWNDDVDRSRLPM